MAESYMDPASGDVEAGGGNLRAWVIGLLGSVALAGVVGLVLAALVPGAARPYAGAAYVLAIGLALVVGASKTSSA